MPYLVLLFGVYLPATLGILYVTFSKNAPYGFLKTGIIAVNGYEIDPLLSRELVHTDFDTGLDSCGATQTQPTLSFASHKKAIRRDRLVIIFLGVTFK